MSDARGKRAFLAEADNLRLHLAHLIGGAQVLGDSMDAPVRLRTDIDAVTLTCIRRCIGRYDAARPSRGDDD